MCEKTQEAHVTNIFTSPKKLIFVTKKIKIKDFQALQGPNFRVIDMKSQLVCSRWCKTLLCQSARKKSLTCKKNFEKHFNYFLAS